MKKKIIRLLNKVVAIFGKRITNFHAPAKPYRQGIAFLKGIIDTPACIIDVGVADGTPDILSSFPYIDYKHLLIDANPKFFDYLDRVHSQYPDTVMIEKCFCGEREQVITMSRNKTGHTSSRYYTAGQTDTIEVPVVQLDTLVQKHKITGPILLKIDVEGAELDVLEGALNTLTMCDVVVLESWINVPGSTHPGDFAAIVSFMKQQSFVVFDFFAGHNHPNGVLAHIDIVFVKQGSKYRIIG